MKTLLRQTIWLASLFLTLSFWRTTLSENKFLIIFDFPNFSKIPLGPWVSGCYIFSRMESWSTICEISSTKFEWNFSFLKSFRNPIILGFHARENATVGVMNMTVYPCMIVLKLKNFISLWKNRKKWLILYFSRMSKIRENRFFGQKLFNFRIIVTFICHFWMSNIFDESFKWENRIEREIWHGMATKTLWVSF